MAALEASDGRAGQRGDPQRRAIHAAAIAQFSERGFSATSIANIADAAGMSRPALYQYFRNKGDIYASAFVALFNDHVDRALQALDDDGTTAKEVQQVVTRLRSGLAAFLARAAPGRSQALSAQRAEWAEVLELSPKGFKFDTPPVAVYRRRLTTLARGVAADIDA